MTERALRVDGLTPVERRPPETDRDATGRVERDRVPDLAGVAARADAWITWA